MNVFRGLIAVFTVSLLITSFQNCGTNFRARNVAFQFDRTSERAPQSVEPPRVGAPSSEAIATKSKLVFKPLVEVTIPGCFPRADGAHITQSTIGYKDVYSDELGRDVHLRAYVHQPPGRVLGAKLPVVVIFHGGGWVANDPTYWFPLSFYLASRGVVAINVQYRLYGAHKSGPEAGVKDALSAVRWVRQNAGELGVDGDKLVALGDSAGGHLTLATALITDLSDERGTAAQTSSVPQALYTLYPVVMTTGPVMLSLPFAHPDPTLGHPGLSPLLLLKPERQLPPTVLWQGTADASVLNPPNLAKEFCQTANALAGGTRCHFVAYPGAGHAFIEEAIGEGAETRGHYREIAANVASFLDDLDFLKSDKSKLLDEMNTSAEHCRDWTYSRYNGYKTNYGYYPLINSAW